MNTIKSKTIPSKTDSLRRVRDPYADLLRDTRGLRRDQATARDAWFSGLGVDHKEEILFELEMFLKGLAAWSNPRNHPRNAQVEPLYSRNFRAHLVVALRAVSRCIVLSGQLLGPVQRAPITRNIPMGFSEEPRGEREATDETPDAALQSLRQALSIHAEILNGVITVEHVSFRRFYMTLASLQREIARNAFFNPLYSLEFRPEFDRVRTPDVLDAILSVEGDLAHRVVTLSYLATFRLMRMASNLKASANDPEGFVTAWVLLAAMRSDAHALSDSPCSAAFERVDRT
jgi:hypothetical protein